MRVLIIGGTGLISTAITRALIARGDAVTLYNRGQTGADIPEGYDTITGNRKDYTAFEAQMAAAGSFDAVIDMIGFVPTDIESAIRAFRGSIGQFIFCIYREIIKQWQRLSAKEAFFGGAESGKT